MSRMIQVRNVPDRLHRELSRRARDRGQTLTEFIENVLEQEVSRPTREEVFGRIATREPVPLKRRAAELVRGERRGATSS